MKDGTLFALGLSLTFLAGWVDAVCFLKFAGLYTSFMSGNTVQLGLGTALGDTARLLPLFEAVALFVLGSLLGGLLNGRGGRWAMALLFVAHAAALSAGAYAAVSDGPATIVYAPIAFAMGIQNQMVARTRADNAGTTFVTGTLFRLGDALAQLVLGTDRSGRAVRLLAVAALFGAGAGAGAALEIRAGAMSMLPPAAFSGLMALLALARAAGRPPARSQTS